MVMSPSRLVRTSVSYSIVFLFLISLLWSGISSGLHTSMRDALHDLPFLTADSFEPNFEEFPDFGQYVFLRTISEDELDLERQRLIFVGDIHGMKSSLDSLLLKLSYKPSDCLVHLGDFMAKGPNSLQVLSQFSDANVTGVRGNHDQKVIEWRGWIEWVEGQKGGKQWLEKLERRSSRGVEATKKNYKQKGLKWLIPGGWKFNADHYKIARSMNASHYSYLKSLPLVIHLPALHTHIVHAGVLPFDPRLSPTSLEQPLAHAPHAPASPTRSVQEQALLTDIAQNTDPWVLQNVRSILDDEEVSRHAKKGTPWSNLWNMIMEQCKGYPLQEARNRLGRQEKLNGELSCFPISVVYGHAAGRGLDIKRWSFGLDTGCVYGHNLTAMVVTDIPTSISDPQGGEVRFGETGKAQLVSVPCSKW